MKLAILISPFVLALWGFDFISDKTALAVLLGACAVYQLMEWGAGPVNRLHEGRDPNKMAFEEHLIKLRRAAIKKEEEDLRARMEKQGKNDKSE